MKKVKFLITAIIFSMMCINVNAQIDRLNRAVQRGVERAVEKKVEEKAEEVTTNALEKAEADRAKSEAEADRAKSEAEAEKALNKAAEAIDEAQKNQEEAEAQVASLPSEVPQVGNKPYTPSESEYAFFAMKKGSVQVFVSKDAKGKITSQSRNTIKEITGEKNAFAIEYEIEMLDEKGNSTNSDEPLLYNYRIVIKDGLMYIDMKGLFGAMDGIEGVQVTGSVVKIPNNLSVGQTIDDAKASVKIGFINCVIITTEGKCLAIEDVKVEAGTFRCYKVSQKTNSTVMGIKSEGKTVTWYAKGVGAVKTETYDKNGKLLSTQELKSNS